VWPTQHHLDFRSLGKIKARYLITTKTLGGKPLPEDVQGVQVTWLIASRTKSLDKDRT
jgi:hypothetical protein